MKGYSEKRKAFEIRKGIKMSAHPAIKTTWQGNRTLWTFFLPCVVKNEKCKTGLYISRCVCTGTLLFHIPLWAR